MDSNISSRISDDVIDREGMNGEGNGEGLTSGSNFADYSNDHEKIDSIEMGDHERGMNEFNEQTNGDSYEDDQEHTETDRPIVELFVKAAVDKMKNGSCPICHRYFLAFYVLRERGLVDLVVTTCLPQDPPKEVLSFSSGKHYPLVKIHKGRDSTGLDISGMECDNVDEIESFLDKFDCEEMKSRKYSSRENQAENSFLDLYIKFNAFLKSTTDDSTPLIKQLMKINLHLAENGTLYMLGEELGRADCYLLPWLQHIRVAGKAYKNFEIPTELTHLWRYLKRAYEADAFKESCPADREIISHYASKASGQPNIPHKRASLMEDVRTVSVPDEVMTSN